MSIDFRPLLLLLLAVPLLAAAPAPATAPAAPQFLPPVACTPGRDCWIVNHVDTDPGPQAADYRCGRQTYDGHQGTDFAVRDMATMNEGVAVLAAAAGKVLRVRDGIEDRLPAEEEIQRMLADNKGCGNGAVIDHGGGWQTIYCHMKKGSIAVKDGDKVTPGQHVGMVGHSGAAEFPHLHFGVFRDGAVIDPFTARGEGQGCDAAAAGARALWLPGIALPYEPVTLYAAGFSDGAPSYESLQQRARNPDTLPADAPALTFWAMMFGAAAGDSVTLTITAPDGSVVAERTATQESHAARQFYYVGRRNSAPLAPGAYTGVMTLTRTQPDGGTVTRRVGRALYIQ